MTTKSGDLEVRVAVEAGRNGEAGFWMDDEFLNNYCPFVSASR